MHIKCLAVSLCCSNYCLCTSYIATTASSNHSSTPAFLRAHSILNKGEQVQNFCDQMPLLSPNSRNQSLDLILSLTTKIHEQRNGHQSLYVGSPNTSTPLGCPGKVLAKCLLLYRHMAAWQLSMPLIQHIVHYK